MEKANKTPSPAGFMSRVSLADMATFDSILQQARSLTPAERIRLAQLLLEESKLESEAEERGVGERGLAAWTSSTIGEDWSEFYPPSLRQRKVG